MVAAALAGAAGAANPKLRAVVSDPVNISLTLNGQKVSTLKPGKYAIVVSDEASDHDFHLTGPGVDKTTTVPASARRPGTSPCGRASTRTSATRIRCFMKGSFTVK